jgi:protein-disulfide isomerase-like protein with CxxC motif
MSEAGATGAAGEKPLSGTVAVERAFRVDGKRVIVRITWPATVAAEIGMDHVMVAARRMLVEAESGEAKVSPIRSP